jgi:hypothetical protein
MNSYNKRANVPWPIAISSTSVVLIALLLGWQFLQNSKQIDQQRQIDSPTAEIRQAVQSIARHLPPPLRAYIPEYWLGLPVHKTNPELGIELPAGASPSDLPPGVTDYLHTPRK